MYLTLNQIAKVDDAQVEDVEIPEWGGSVKVRGMTAKERLQLATIAQEDSQQVLANMAKFALLNGVIEPDITEEDIDMVLSKSSAAVERIVACFNKLSGTGEEAVLEARGNS